MALLQFVSGIDPATPVILLGADTLFSESLAYQTRVGRGLLLCEIPIVRLEAGDLTPSDLTGDLHRPDIDLRRHIRKSPLCAVRWRETDKPECGIHFVNGAAVQSPSPPPFERP